MLEIKYHDYREIVLHHLSDYRKNVLGCKEKGVFRNKEYGHILPKEKETLNFLFNIRKYSINDLNSLNYRLASNITLHRAANHLNSSQVMCLNFFAPFLQSAEGRNSLVSIFSDVLSKDFSASKIEAAGFEYQPNASEGTSFDFYLKLSTGEQILVETKYTEQYFGKITRDKKYPDRYQREWDSVYSHQVKNSLYLSKISSKEFYKHYQIYRNISYVYAETDYSLFLYPKISRNLQREAVSTIGIPISIYPNVVALDWNDFYNSALRHTSENLKNNISEFHTKYFPAKIIKLLT